MIRFNPENKDKITFGEIFDGAIKVKTEEEAIVYFFDYLYFIKKHNDEELTIEELIVNGKSNLNYFSGYYNDQQIYKLISNFYKTITIEDLKIYNKYLRSKKLKRII